MGEQPGLLGCIELGHPVMGYRGAQGTSWGREAFEGLLHPNRIGGLCSCLPPTSISPLFPMEMGSGVEHSEPSSEPIGPPLS